MHFNQFILRLPINILLYKNIKEQQKTDLIILGLSQTQLCFPDQSAESLFKSNAFHKSWGLFYLEGVVFAIWEGEK